MSSKKNKNAKAHIYGQKNKPFLEEKNKMLKLYMVHSEVGSQQVTTLLRFKKLEHEKVSIDITKPRPDWYYAMMPSGLAPCLSTKEGSTLYDPVVILEFLEERYPGPKYPSAWPSDPLRKANARRLIRIADEFYAALNAIVLNQIESDRESLLQAYLSIWRRIDDFLIRHNPKGTFLFDDVGSGGFGLPEIVFTPMFETNWLVEYYEDFQVPDTLEYARVMKWRDACLNHNMSSVVCKEEISKLWYDAAKGVPMGEPNPDTTRQYSSYAMEPHWTSRPMPNKDKYNYSCTDDELGLIPKVSSARHSPMPSPNVPRGGVSPIPINQLNLQ
ncbi:hypothetical protein SARC_11000 [Sphaeroforma arctica JP610]|uniref:GST N-terminal domain-containing protein n=1 Tax=Sphaeroforma arctica JP610 TaxID=667725 RepID=A0A0L0FIC0_9EUKA|nr:hypothetical protein SARC_11000 [Sphaeroforma arctica JP610]KNC76500.1 hypothetical protein SARC_11000 [Sphaeroforma arctica JP610]|eukprot:XP_014150402.1 hypothetical protein SARC_11000 [Sphaeroforma arctica JP610]